MINNAQLISSYLPEAVQLQKEDKRISFLFDQLFFKVLVSVQKKLKGMSK